MREFLLLVFFVGLFLAQLFIGALLILSFEKMVPAQWLQAFLPALRRQLRLRWPVAMIFLILFLARPLVFPWAHEARLHGSFQHSYFSSLSFALREALVFLIFFLLAWRLETRRQKTGAGALVLLLLAGSAFAVDWLMSLEPAWYSTAFGIVFLIACLLSSYSLALLRSREVPLRSRVDANVVHFVLIGVWCYLNFCQFLIVWSSNLPQEAAWYALRSQGNLRYFLNGLLILQLLLPMPSLLFKEVKESRKGTLFFAACSFTAQLGWAAWMILPLFREVL